MTSVTMYRATLQAEDIELKQKEEQEAQAKKEQEERNSIWSYVGMDARKEVNNWETNKTNTLTSPVTGVFNGASYLLSLGEKDAMYNSYDADQTPLAGVGGSFLSLIKAPFIGVGKIAGALGSALGGKSPQQSGGAQQAGVAQSSGGSSGTGGTQSTEQQLKSMQDQLAKIQKTLDAQNSSSTSKTSSSDKPSKTSSSDNTNIARLSEVGSNSYRCSNGYTFDVTEEQFDPEGYQEYDGTVRALTEEFSKAIQDEQEALTQLERKAEAYNKAQAELGKESSNVQVYAQKSAQLKAIPAEINELNSKVTNLGSQIAAQNRVIDSYKGKSDDLSKSRIEQARQTIKALEAEQNALQDKIKQKEAEKTKLESEVNNLKDKISDDNKAKTAAFEKVAKEVEELKCKVDNAKMIKDNARNKLDEAKAKAKENVENKKMGGAAAQRAAQEKENKILDEYEKMPIMQRRNTQNIMNKFKPFNSDKS